MEFDYLQKCQKYSQNVHFVQGAGGNISFKDNHSMYIKASGYFLRDILTPGALSEVDWQGIVDYHKTPESSLVSEAEYLGKIRSFKSEGSKNPSMETGFHALLGKYVVHSHPTVVNVFLCSEEGKRILQSILNWTFDYVPYVAPGQMLTSEIQSLLSNKSLEDVSVFMLENHGLIVAGNDYEQVFQVQDNIFETCRSYLVENNKNGILFDKCMYDENYQLKGFLFPDQIVFADTKDKTNISFLENMGAAIWIDKMMSQLGWTPRYISQNEVNKVANMQAEAERKKILR